MEDCDFALPGKNYDLRTRDEKLTGIFLFLIFFFTAPSVFVGFKNVSALENKNSSIKGMCQRWPAIHGQFALQS